MFRRGQRYEGIVKDFVAARGDGWGSEAVPAPATGCQD